MENKLSLKEIFVDKEVCIFSEHYTSPQDTSFRQVLSDLGYTYPSGHRPIDMSVVAVSSDKPIYYYIDANTKSITYSGLREDTLFYYNLNDIDLDEKPKKLSKGDMVYFTRNIKHDKSGAYRFAVGKKGTIMDISDFKGNITYHVSIDGCTNPFACTGLYSLTDCELELVEEKNIDSGKDHNEGETMNNFDFYEVDQMVNKFYDKKLNDVDVHFENRCDRIIMETELYTSMVSAIKYLAPIPGYDAHTEAMAHIKSFAKIRDRLPAKVLKEFNKARDTQMNEREQLNIEKTKVRTLLHLCQTYEQITALLTEYHII